MGSEQRDYGEREYLVYRLLERLSSNQNRSISKTQFYKLTCMADRYLQDELDTDIEFPRFWYKYGEMPYRYGFERDFYRITPGSRKSPQTVEIINLLSIEDFGDISGAKENIDRAVQWIVRKFANENVQDIKDYHYDRHAPKEFIRTFDEFREEARSFNPGQVGLSDFVPGMGDPTSQEDKLKELLKELVITYPDELYGEMFELFLRWENTMSLLIDQEKADEVEDLTSAFEEALSRVEFRIHHNQNIVEWKVDEWKEERDRYKQEFSEELEVIREAALSEQTEFDELESISEPYSETMRSSF